MIENTKQDEIPGGYGVMSIVRGIADAIREWKGQSIDAGWHHGMELAAERQRCSTDLSSSLKSLVLVNYLLFRWPSAILAGFYLQGQWRRAAYLAEKGRSDISIN